MWFYYSRPTLKDINSITIYFVLFTAQVPFAPHILTHPTDTSAAAPFSGVFTCSVTGCGHLNITWYRRGSSLPTESESTEVSSPTVTTSTLVIPNVTSEVDVGRYCCVVWANKRGAQSNDGVLYFAGKYDIAIMCSLVSKLL